MIAAPIQFIPTPEQVAAEVDIAAGQNVLVTGPAGSGKSLLLSRCSARSCGRLSVTASTGIAAMNIGGLTIHSFAGIGRAEGDPQLIAAKVAGNRQKVQLLRELEVLAIDEISMLSGEVFDILDVVLRKVRGERVRALAGEPFGGVQLLCFGDFLQLPPVSRPGTPARFAFESQAWKAARFRIHIFTRVFRQSNQALADAFGRLRVGDIFHPHVEIIAGRNNAALPEDGPKPVVIHTRNVDVDRLNCDALSTLPGQPRFYFAEDSGAPLLRERLDRDCLAPAELHLKEGANVMLLANLDTAGGLVNGSMGVVLHLDPDEVTVRFGQRSVVSVRRRRFEIGSQSQVLASRLQFPLRLAYALTAHKSQGLTLDRIVCHLHPSQVFEHGMAYVAVSRVKTLGGLFLRQSSRTAFRAHPKALAFYAGV